MPNDEKDQRVSLAGVDPVEALRALLEVDPESEPVETQSERCSRRSPEGWRCYKPSGHRGGCHFDPREGAG